MRTSLGSRAAAGLFVVLVGLVCGAGCGGGRTTSMPSADDAPTPTTAARTEDPGDSPQLAAVPTVVTRPDITPPEPPENQFATLAERTSQLLRRVGSDALFVEIEVSGSSMDWEVRAAPGSDFTDSWSWQDRSDGSGLEQRKNETPTDRESFDLTGVNLSAPRQLADGVLRRLPGAQVYSAVLAVDEEHGLHWELSVSAPGASFRLLAAPDGDVWAVLQ